MSEPSVSLKAFAAQSNLRRPAPIEVPREEEADYQAFGYGRVGRRPEIMIEFQKANGYRLALQYIDVKEIETHDPDKGFVIHAPRRKITVEGDGLLNCYRYLRQNRIAELVECDRPTAMAASAGDPIITCLRIQKAGAEER